MGNHRHALDNLRILREWLEAGAIGAVRDVHLWTDRPNERHFAAIGVHGLEARPTDRPPVPEGMDWNLWLGTRPERPYHPLYAPVQWRSWYDFGTGSLGDMGCHIFDGPFWSLQLGYPESVEAEVSNRNDETFPKWSIITYRFPARGAMPPVKLVWYDGGKLPPRPKQLEAGRNLQVEGGQLYYGDKGAIMTGSYANACRLIPETAMKEYGKNRPAATYPRSVGHFKEWIEACKGGPAPGSNFDYAGVLTEVVLLGVLAVRTGKKIECDPKTGRILNLPEDHPYIRLGFRKF
jgi:predicted dehydrogenase